MSAPEPLYDSAQSPYRTLALPVYLPSLCMSIGQGAAELAIPLFAYELTGSASLAALAFAARGFGSMLINLPAGVASARLGDKFTLGCGILLMLGSALGAFFVQNIWQLAAVVFVFGAGQGTWLLARLHHVAEHIHTGQRGKAVATLGGLQRIGRFIGPAIAGLIAQYSGYETVFIFTALLAALVLLLVWIFIRRNSRSARHPQGMASQLLKITIEHRRAFLTAGAAMVALGLVRTGRQLILPLWGEFIGLDPVAIGLVTGLSYALDTAMFVPAGIVLDRYGRKYAGIPCMLVLSLAMLLLPLTGGFWSFLAVGLLAGLGNGIGTGINMTLGADLAPADQRGEFLGVWRLVGDLGVAGGPLFTGAITHFLMLAAASTATAGIGFIGLAWFIFTVRETRKQP